MLRRRTICGFFILLAGLAVAQDQIPTQPAQRPRPQGRRRPDTMNPTLPSVTPSPTPVPFTPVPFTPAPFSPTPGAVTPPTPPGQQQQTAPPLPPLPPLGPSLPPVVTYHDGLLTVQALNSTLGSVLTAIRNKTGIEFEGGEGAMDMVAISLGPAAEGEVLAAIFSGSGFDFVALGRPDSPGIVQRVILKPNNKNGPMAATNAIPQAPRVIQDGDEEENVPEEQLDPSSVPQPQDIPVQAPPTGLAQPRTPEQFQQQFQQRQQLQQQQLQQQLQQQQLQQQQLEEDPSRAPRKHPPL